MDDSLVGVENLCCDNDSFSSAKIEKDLLKSNN
jgi:hypothetical protein